MLPPMHWGNSLIVASSVAAGLLVASPTHADDTQDQIFLTSLGNRGVSCASLPGCGGNDQLLGLGQALCKDMAITFDPELEANSLIVNQGFTKQQAAVVVGSAIGAYCPQFLPALHQQAGGN